MRYLMMLASLLVLPLAWLLFLQWPLREWVQAYSRQTNDAGQIIFALYVAVAVTAASLKRVHLAAHTGSTPHPLARRWGVWVILLCVGPWALFMLWAAAGPIMQSVSVWESFTETLTPAYFVIKLALGLLLALVLLEAVLSAWSTLKSGAQR
jgi:hypothetical protein